MTTATPQQEIRQRSGLLELLSVEKKPKPSGGGKGAVVILRCHGCGRDVQISASRWKNQPPESCIKCFIKKSKRAGYHGFRARKTYLREQDSKGGT